MDALDRIVGAGLDLLSRVDSVLARFGAPEHHPVWPLLRRLGVLPGDAVGAVAALRPASLAGVGPDLRLLSREYAELPILRRLEWQGQAADAFGARWTAFSAHLTGETDSLASRLIDTARYAEAVADWADRTRLAVARTLAAVLTSAEAVTVITGTDLVPLAAADIAARVLGAVADAYDEAEELLAGWPGLLDELTVEPPGPPISTDTRSQLAVEK